jgi:hypothetical protein
MREEWIYESRYLSDSCDLSIQTKVINYAVMPGFLHDMWINIRVGYLGQPDFVGYTNLARDSICEAKRSGRNFPMGIYLTKDNFVHSGDSVSREFARTGGNLRPAKSVRLRKFGGVNQWQELIKGGDVVMDNVNAHWYDVLIVDPGLQ